MKSNSQFDRPKYGRLALGILLCSIQLYGCGKDQKDTAELNGETGNVPGSFIMRPASAWRAKIDSLQAQITGLFPGLDAALNQRFSDDGAGLSEETESNLQSLEGNNLKTDEGGFKLSDLVAISLPSTENETINRQLFGSLKSAKDESGGLYFDTIDTEKYTGKKWIHDTDLALYDPPEGSTQDAYYAKQYYLEMIRWPDAVKTEVTSSLLATAAPVVVAVLDTGVNTDHEDLKNAVWKSATGVVGYDSTTKSGREVNTSTDPDGHGTHVAGIIGATPKNSVAIQGVAAIPGRGGDTSKYLAEIMPVTVLNANGSGTSEMISRGIKWAVDSHRKQKTTDSARTKQKLIINMSLGGPFDISGYKYEKAADGSPILEDDLFNDAVKNDDVLIVVAAGNESCRIGGACGISGQDFRETYYYPCSYKHVLCVAATTQDDKLAGFSNRRASVGISAPGWQIVSTSNDSSNTKAAVYSGTSQATPVTAGAAAVVWALYPDLKASDLKSVLIKSAAKISNVTTEVASGNGRLDLYAAMLYAKELKSAGKTPDQADPSTGVIATTSPTVDSSKMPDASVDPYLTSPDAKGGSGSPTGGRRGKGTGGGCGVVAAPYSVSNQSATSSWAGLIVLLFAVLLPAANIVGAPWIRKR